jgi:osmotically-inducible protein OsmY
MRWVIAFLVALAVGPPASAQQQRSTGDKLERVIRDKLAREPELADDKIDVAVYDGVARLTGTVDSVAERAKAVRVAELAGAPIVDDRLVVETRE